ncbi:hypothetical protein H8D57_03945 [bacterium]|nr:hypothetical protein [bacterium]
MSTETPSLVIRNNENVTMPMTATVTGQSGNAISGINLKFELHPQVEGGSIFGSLTSPNPTNANGVSSVSFSPNGETGRQKVVCYVSEADGYLSEVRDEIQIEVKSLDEVINSFQVSARPLILYVGEDEPETSFVEIYIRDAARLGIQDVRVDLSSEFGFLPDQVITDASGWATANYIVDDQVIPEEQTDVTIYCSINGTDWAMTATVTVIPDLPGSASLYLTTDVNQILADNGITFANLTATLRNQFNEPMPNKEIMFIPSEGVAQSPIMTDADGVARTIFTDAGRPSLNELGDLVPAQVTARSAEFNVESSVQITIYPWIVVDNVVFVLSHRETIVGSLEAIDLTARCYRPDGTFVGNGVPVHFSALSGRVAPAISMTVDGIAISSYFPSLVSGTDTVRAEVNSDVGLITREASILVQPELPARVTMEAAPGTLFANDPVNFSLISAQIVDRYNNPVRPRTDVTFSTSRGHLGENEQTDNNGIAFSNLFAGPESGLALVTTTVNGEGGPIQTVKTVLIQPARPSSIRLSSDPDVIQVSGVGGISTSTITAELRDEFGEIVINQANLRIEVISAPPDEYYDVLLSDSVITNDGIAIWDFQAGEESKNQWIRFYTWADEYRMEVIENFIRIRINPGPAHFIDVNYNPEGIDAGGEFWSTEVAIKVEDIYRNPAYGGTVVNFEIDPDIAEIAPCQLGRPNRYGHYEPRMAYSEMIYSGRSTFEMVEVTAFVNVGEGRVVGIMDVTLPLQEGNITFNAHPNLDWHFEEGMELSNIRCQVLLTDGHDTPINNGQIVFSSDQGLLFRYFEGNDEYIELERDEIRYTGLVDNENDEAEGEATVFLRMTEQDVFEDGEAQEAQITVNAVLLGYPEMEVEPVVITFTRVVE